MKKTKKRIIMVIAAFFILIANELIIASYFLNLTS